MRIKTKLIEVESALFLLWIYSLEIDENLSNINKRIYPLIKEKDQIHIVKDSYYCVCGLVFNKERVIKGRL